MRDLERDIIPMCRDEGMGICAWATLGQGRFQTAATFAERANSKEGRTGRPPSVQEKAVSAALESIATRKECSIQNVALAYCLAKAPYVFPIVGGRKVEYLKGNIGGLTVRLSKEDIDEIEKSYVFDPGFPHTFISGTYFTGQPPRGDYDPGEIWLTKFMGNFDWVEPARAIQPAEV
jgi:aryl-alcohol dehydrogenase-like predicted oxidoreductase